jgi:putative chitobiose transport system substrate-binding protein
MKKRGIALGLLGLGLSAGALVAFAQQKTEIAFWTYYLSPNFDAYIKSSIEDFQKANPDITVNWTDKQDTMERDLVASINLGKAPDVVNLWQDSTFAGAQGKILTPLADLVKPEDLKSTYYENVLQLFTVDGKPYGFPWYGWLDQGVMMYNPELLQKAGLTKLPKTLSELYTYSAIIKRKTGAYGYLPSVKDPNGASFLGQFFLEGLPIYDANGKAAFNSARHAALLGQFVRMMKEDTIPQELLRKEAFQLSNELYSQAKVAFILGAPTSLTRVKEANLDLYKKTKIADAPLGKAGIQSGGGMDLVIPSASKNKPQAVLFAQFMTNRTNQVKFANVVPIVCTAKGCENDEGLKAKSGDPIEIGKGMVSSGGKLINPGFKPPKNTDDIYKNFNDNIEAAFLGKKSPQQALTDAVTFWNANAK